MIVNPYSTTALTLDLLSTGLATVTLWQTASLLLKGGERDDKVESLTRREDRLYLVFWLGAVFLLLRLLLWPFFYLVLQSFVPEVEGTMCIFGVRNLLPRLTKGLELIKPLLFFLGLVWLILFRLERFARKGPGGRSMLVLLLICALIGLVESAGSAVLWIRASAELAVSCCTTITDIPTRFTVWVPLALLGPQYTLPLWYIYFGLNTVVSLAAIRVWSLLQSGKEIGKIALPLLAVVALVNGVISTLAFIEVIAPRLMEMPFHHCIYCLVETLLDAPLILALFILGTFLLMAAAPVSRFASAWATPSALRRTLNSLLLYGALFLIGSMVMVGVHLVTDGIW